MSEHILMLGPISKYMLQGLLPTSQQGALFNYLDILGRLWSRQQSICDIDKLISDTAAAQTAAPLHPQHRWVGYRLPGAGRAGHEAGAAAVLSHRVAAGVDR